MTSRSSKLLLPCVLAAFTILWFTYPHEFVASDPWQYSLRAYQITQGTFFESPDDHPFSHRLGLTLPVSLAYRVLGVSILSTHLWPLCCALLILCTIWLAAPRGRPRVFALLIGACCVPLFRASTMLYPDIVVAAFTGLASLVFYHRAYSLRDNVWWSALPVAAVLLLCVAFLAKLSAWWILPHWLVVAILDIRKREWRLLRRFYLPALCTAGLLCAGYLWFNASFWGDPFSRLHGVEALTGQHLWSWSNAPSGQLISRLTVDPVILMGGGYNIVPLLALLSWPVLSGRSRFWLGYSLSILVCFWFGSASLHAYEPLPLSIRMTLPILPGIAVAAGCFADRMAFRALPKNFRRNQVVLNLVLVAMIFLPLLQHLFLYRNTSLPEVHAMRLLQRDLAVHNASQAVLVCADHRSVSSLAYYFSYSYPPNLLVIPIDQTTSAVLKGSDRVYVYLHEDRAQFLEEMYGERNYVLETIRATNKDAFFREGPVWLWKYTVPESMEKLTSVGKQRSS